jgi:hypothetical protein
MQKRLNTCLAAAAVLAVAALASPSAEAMTVMVPSGLNAAIRDANPVQEAAYNCRPVWRCGAWGCGWRRACWWGPGPYGYYPYRPYRHGWHGGHRRWW